LRGINRLDFKRGNAEAICPLQTTVATSGGLLQCPSRARPRPMAFHNDAGFSFFSPEKTTDKNTKAFPVSYSITPL